MGSLPTPVPPSRTILYPPYLPYLPSLFLFFYLYNNQNPSGFLHSWKYFLVLSLFWSLLKISSFSINYFFLFFQFMYFYFLSNDIILYTFTYQYIYSPSSLNLSLCFTFITIRILQMPSSDSFLVTFFSVPQSFLRFFCNVIYLSSSSFQCLCFILFVLILASSPFLLAIYLFLVLLSLPRVLPQSPSHSFGLSCPNIASDLLPIFKTYFDLLNPFQLQQLQPTLK